MAMTMNSHRRNSLLAVAVLSFACVVSPALLRAQAPPGPLPPTQPSDAPPPAAKPRVQKAPVEPRTSIFGAWKFDQDDSDDPRKKMQEARNGGSNGGYGGNRRMGGGYPGGGYPGGGYPGGGGGGYGRPRMGSQGESDEDRQRLEELFNPSHSLTIA